MSQAKDNDSAKNRFLKTEHERVYYLDNKALAGRGEFEVRCQIADAIPDVNFVITMRPYRSYNLQYKVIKSNLVWLDFYSVRPAEDYNPEDVVQDIKKGLTVYVGGA